MSQTHQVHAVFG